MSAAASPKAAEGARMRVLRTEGRLAIAAERPVSMMEGWGDDGLAGESVILPGIGEAIAEQGQVASAGGRW